MNYRLTRSIKVSFIFTAILVLSSWNFSHSSNLIVDPIDNDIIQTLASISNRTPLKKKNFLEICRAYIASLEKEELLAQTLAANKELGETIVVFNKLLFDAGADIDRSNKIIQHMYRHYVINTKGPIPQSDMDISASDVEDHFDVFQEATNYAQLLGIGVSKSEDGTSMLHVNGRDIPCPSWGVQFGKSPAMSLREVGPVINKARYGRNDVIPSFAFGFDENAQKYTLENAMSLADLSQLAYLDAPFIKNQLAFWGFNNERFIWIEDPSTDTQAFITEKNNSIVVCFRGTGSGTDWMVDLKLFRTKSIDGRGGVHSGFKGALDKVWAKISNRLQLDPNKKIFFTGHSLGAALAQLAAYRQAISDPDRIAGVYVYGSPRVGNGKFKSAYNESLKHKTYAHINNNDIVTQIPPRILGYHQMSQVPRKFDIGHRISLPENTSGDEAIREQNFEDLDASTQFQIRMKLEQAQRSVQSSTRFLEIRPQQMPTVTYSTTFETGRVDDHGIEQYLFKLGCAIVEERFETVTAGR